MEDQNKLLDRFAKLMEEQTEEMIEDNNEEHLI